MVGLEGLDVLLKDSGKFCSQFKEGDCSLRFFFHKKAGVESKKLFVLFPGAYDKSKGITQFQRYSWSKMIPGNVLILDDPAVEDGNEVSIGWFQKKGEKDNFSCINKFLRYVVRSLEIGLDDVVFFGSSAGGFASLKMLEYLPESNAIVINPQVNILNYSKSHVKKILKYKYGHEDVDSLSDNEKKQLAFFSDFSGKGKIFYYQNTFDEAHIKKQLGFFLSLVPNNVEVTKLEYQEGLGLFYSKVNIIYYSDKERGHSPPSKDITLDFLRRAML